MQTSNEVLRASHKGAHVFNAYHRVKPHFLKQTYPNIAHEEVFKCQRFKTRLQKLRKSTLLK